MSDENQVLVPPSFVSLFVPPGGLRPTASRAHITERYEFCEALAQLLLERAGALQWELGITDDDVLERMRAGLTGEAAPVPEAEAGWVLSRLRELMEEARPPWQR